MRVLLVCAGLLVLTWLEFRFFPGHTYLQSGTQLYLPILERLDTPGFLSRDLVATHPNVTFTIYDEITIFLKEAGKLDFRTALTGQQLLFRLAALTGVFLLAKAAGLNDLFALLMTAVLNLGGRLVGPSACLADPEPVPQAFAFESALLAAGLLAMGKPLLSGLAAGIAFIYDPLIAMPFWITVLLALLFERKLRLLLRPMLPVLLVFCLLLANLVQLQPGIPVEENLFRKVSDTWAFLQKFRTSYVWVSTWTHDLWNYLFLFVCALWAAARIWPTLNRQMRWLMVGLPFYGILSVPLSALLLERFKLAFVPQMQPARALLYTVEVAWLLCGIAGLRAIRLRRFKEAASWFAVVIAILIDAQILELARGPHAWQMARAASGISHSKDMTELAGWAEQSTWGSSMFVFPDAGQQGYPGEFRAMSRRAVWVDWKSGAVVDHSETAAIEWWKRWEQLRMEQPFSAARLEGLLVLPADYFVLKRGNALADVRTAFVNREFVVYEAQDLRNASTGLRLVRPVP